MRSACVAALPDEAVLVLAGTDRDDDAEADDAEADGLEAETEAEAEAEDADGVADIEAAINRPDSRSTSWRANDAHVCNSA